MIPPIMLKTWPENPGFNLRAKGLEGLSKGATQKLEVARPSRGETTMNPEGLDNLRDSRVLPGCLITNWLFFLISENIPAIFRLQVHGHLSMVGAMKRYIALSALFLTLCTSLFAAEDPVALAEIQEVTEVPGLDYLSEIGQKLGCHFTVEYRSYLLTGKMPKIRENVSNDLSISSLAALVTKLRRDLPGYTIATDPKHAKVVHIVEDALENQKDYVLNKKLTLKYSGHLATCEGTDEAGRRIPRGIGLVRALAEQVGNLQQGSDEAGNARTIIDCWTEVNVDVKNQAVRSILTDCLPISNYKAVLWRAVTTRDVHGKTVVTVQFSGQRPSKVVSSGAIARAAYVDQSTAQSPNTEPTKTATINSVSLICRINQEAGELFFTITNASSDKIGINFRQIELRVRDAQGNLVKTTDAGYDRFGKYQNPPISRVEYAIREASRDVIKDSVGPGELKETVFFLSKYFDLHPDREYRLTAETFFSSHRDGIDQRLKIEDLLFFFARSER
jgi:hypothetical protein